MGLFKDFCNQTRKPEGFLGKLMVNGMNSGHAKLADWGMSVMNGISASHIAELGCGGGRNARELLERYPQATLAALDYSEVSVAKTKKRIRKQLGQADARSFREMFLPFPLTKTRLTWLRPLRQSISGRAWRSVLQKYTGC